MALKDKYINLFTDFGFKKVFGEEANKDLLIDFLNQILPTAYTIQEVSFSKNDHLGKAAPDRKAIFDIYCTTPQGEHFIVELQKARQDFFKDRSVFYASFPIQEMAQKGKWNFQLSPVFTIGILNFTFKDHQKDTTTLRHHVQLKDQDCKVFYEKLHFIYLELPKFTKTLEECTTRYEKWLWIFKHLPDLEDIPNELKEEVFLKLFQISAIANFDKQERKAYEQSLKYLRDLNNVVNTARREGEQIGLDKAKKQINKAKDKAKIAEDKVKIAEDKAKIAEDKAKIAQNTAILAMLQNTDLSNEAIANALGVNIERVRQLKK